MLRGKFSLVMSVKEAKTTLRRFSEILLSYRAFKAYTPVSELGLAIKTIQNIVEINKRNIRDAPTLAVS